MEPVIHTLKNGATVLTTSPHAFRFSDGTVSEPQHKEVCDAMTLTRRAVKVGEILGMPLNAVRFEFSDQQLAQLRHLCSQADIVLLPFPVLQSLREQGKRNEYPNAVAFNATTETQRSGPTEKVVDINNWSY